MRPTFEMLARGDSVGVFQLEGAGMRDLMRKMKPDHINDLVALVALYRPGPMDSIPKYIACKNGKEAPEYLHPALEPILNETYGVMTYQEDVMRIARELAGYTHGRRPTFCAAPWARRSPAEMVDAARNVHEGRGRARHHAVASPSRFSSRRQSSPATASTRAMPRPMRRSPIRRPI